MAGVSLRKNGSFNARLQTGKKRVCLGYFRSFEEAQDAYNKHYQNMFGTLPLKDKEIGEIDQTKLNQLFEYRDGRLFWRVELNRRNRPGLPVVRNAKASRYNRCTIEGKSYPIHYLVWKLHGGRNLEKEEIIDHIDGNSKNNAIENLRVIKSRDNPLNRICNRTNGYFGAFRKRGYWGSKIVYDGKQILLGSFKTQEEASQEYKNKYFELYNRHPLQGESVK